MKKSIILLCSLVLAAIFLFMGCDVPVDENQSEEQETQYYGYYNSDEEFVCVWGTVQ